jgi:hypothetical protein
MINTNTLENISKYSNKLIKLASYFSQTEDKLIFNQLSILSENSPLEDILEGFNKDLQTTTNHIFDVQKILGSTDSNGVISELDNEEKNISVLFGDKYDPTTRTVTIAGIELRLDSELSKAEIKDLLSDQVVGMSFNNFKTTSKLRMEDKKWELYELETDEDKIDYLSRTVVIQDMQEVAKKITDSTEDFRIARRNMSIDTRNLVDRNITGSRAMVDSITQNSTYINQDGIQQIGSKHKKEKEKIETIQKLIKDSNINDIELDTDTDLVKVIDVLKKVNELKLNIHNSFTFKVRKLGNYKANGLYMPSQNLVAVDVSKPSALIHEIVHLIDINNKDILQSEARQNIILAARQELDASGYDNKFARYISSPNEIIARLGEVSYLLNKYDYKEGSVKSFMDKVSLFQKDEKQSPTDINIAKSVEEYRGMSKMYFDFDSWDETFAQDVKSYYNAYFTDNTLDLKPIENLKVNKIIDPEKARTVKAKGPRSAVNLFTGFNKDNVERIFDNNIALNLIDETFLVNTLFMNAGCVSRISMATGGKSAASVNQISNSWGTIEKIGEIAQNKNQNFKNSVWLMASLLDKESLSSNDTTMMHLSNTTVEELTHNDKLILINQGYSAGNVSLTSSGSKRYNQKLTKIISDLNEDVPLDVLLDKLNSNYDLNFLKATVTSVNRKEYEFAYTDEKMIIDQHSPLFTKSLKTLSRRVLTEDQAIKFISAYDKIECDDDIKNDHACGYLRSATSVLPFQKDINKVTFDDLKAMVKKYEKQDKKVKNRNNLSLF